MQPAKPYRLIFYPPIEWGGLFQRPHHLSLQLARLFEQVLYIQPAGLRNPVLKDLGRLGNLFSQRPKNLRGRGLDNRRVRVCSLPFLPFQGLSAFDVYNGWIFSHIVNRDKQAYEDTIIWIGAPAPFLKKALKKLHFATVVFDWMDDYSIFSHLPSRVVDMQYWMLKRADLVFASSEILLRRAAQIRRDRLWLLPNGVDLAHWSLPEGPCSPQRPFGDNVIGYFGTISHWLDKELVHDLAEGHKDWNFVFVGPRADNGGLDHIFGLSNCHHVTSLPYDELPAVASGFDVCWIPFKMTSRVKSINPVKAYEYLAMGKPVVSIPLPDLEPLEGAISFATDLSAFERAISRALSGKGQGASPQERRAAVASYSWERLGQKAAAILKEFLNSST